MLRIRSDSGTVSLDEVAEVLVEECRGDARAALASEVRLHQILAGVPSETTPPCDATASACSEALIDEVIRECDGVIRSAVIAMLRLNNELLLTMREKDEGGNRSAPDRP